MLRLIFILFLSTTVSVSAQEDSFQKQLEHYLTINGTHNQYSGAFDQMFDVIKQNYGADQVPEKVWKELQTGKDKAVNDVIMMLTSVYRKHYTPEDIEQLLTFFQTDTGKQLAVGPDTLNEAQRKALGEFYETPVGMKVSQTQEAIGKDIMQVSEYWSRDLYLATLTSLKDKGYKPNHDH